MRAAVVRKLTVTPTQDQIIVALPPADRQLQAARSIEFHDQPLPSPALVEAKSSRKSLATAGRLDLKWLYL